MTAGEGPLLFVMGPTGAGKSALALALAARLPVEIVSVDSAQVYRGFDIGTAKPNPAVQRRVRHHLLDICAPCDAYSAAQFRSDAQSAIADIRARGRVPMLVGGTGLYFRALEQGLSELPAATPAVRAAARIHPNDPQRLLRALEVHAVSGIAQSDLWERARLAPHRGQIVKLVIAPADRALLQRRLALRFDLMLERGFINEVRALRDRAGLGADAPAMRTVGYREVWRYLVGDSTRAHMIERGVIATRQLAKRQLTWLRREAACHWLDCADTALTDRALRIIQEQNVFKRNVYDLE